MASKISPVRWSFPYTLPLAAGEPQASQIISFDDKELAVANSSIDSPRPYSPYGLSAVPEYDNHIVTDSTAIVNKF